MVLSDYLRRNLKAGSDSIPLVVDSDIESEVSRALLEGLDVHFVAGVREEPFDLLRAVKSTEAQAAIVSCTENGGMPGICTHLFAQFPSLVIVGVCRKSGRTYVWKQVVSTRRLKSLTLDSLLSEIRAAA